MHYRMRAVALAVHHPLQERLLGRLVASLEAGLWNRAATVWPDRDRPATHWSASSGSRRRAAAPKCCRWSRMSGRAGTATPASADLFARCTVLTFSLSHALRKKFSAPKLPDFSASAISSPAPPRVRARVHGTPGSISGPMVSTPACNAITAPEVSPPATISRLTPRAGQGRRDVAQQVFHDGAGLGVVQPHHPPGARRPGRIARIDQERLAPRLPIDPLQDISPRTGCRSPRPADRSAVGAEALPRSRL